MYSNHARNLGPTSLVISLASTFHIFVLRPGRRVTPSICKMILGFGQRAMVVWGWGVLAQGNVCLCLLWKTLHVSRMRGWLPISSSHHVLAARQGG